MDLLRNSYANDSDEEPEPVTDNRLKSITAAPSLPFKRPYPEPEDRHYKPARKPNPPYGSSHPDPQTSSSTTPVPITVPGRYVSKRERSLLASLSTVPIQNQSSDSIQKPSVSSPTGNLRFALNLPLIKY